MKQRNYCSLTIGVPVLVVLSTEAQNSSDISPGAIEDRIAHSYAAPCQQLNAIAQDRMEMDFRLTLGTDSIEPGLFLFHRGVMLPYNDHGPRFKGKCGKTLVVSDGEAQVIRKARTSLYEWSARVPERMAYSQESYKPLHWLNINVGINTIFDKFDVRDPFKHQDLDPIPQFVSFQLNKALLKRVLVMDGGYGIVDYRRVLQPQVFSREQLYIDHLILYAESSVGPHSASNVSEVFYVMSGNGTVNLGQHSAEVHAGDVIPVRLGESRAFANTRSKPLELLVIGVAKDTAAKSTLGTAVA